MTKPRSILVVEDEPAIAELLRRYLEAAGFATTVVGRADDALAAVAAAPPALVVLDRGLPDADGLKVARRLDGRVPVVVLTARGDEPDRMEGFAVGVDDYVPKPFSPRELVARVEAVLRRTAPAPAPAPPLERDGIRLDGAARTATRDGAEVLLTQREFDLAWALLEAAGRVLTREALVERVWADGVPDGTRTVDQHVAQLRAKLGHGVVRTVRGLGYRAG